MPVLLLFVIFLIITIVIIRNLIQVYSINKDSSLFFDINMTDNKRNMTYHDLYIILSGLKESGDQTKLLNMPVMITTETQRKFIPAQNFRILSDLGNLPVLLVDKITVASTEASDNKK